MADRLRWDRRVRRDRRIRRWSRSLREHGDPTVLWSKGYALLCDTAGPPGFLLRDTEEVQSESFFREHYSGAHGLVWVRLGTRSREGEASDLDHFVNGALATIEEPFVLVTTDGDASVPSHLSAGTVERLLGSPHFAGWLTLNLDTDADPRLRPIPIGLDLHRSGLRLPPHEQVARLRKIARAAAPSGTRSTNVFCDLGVSENSDERREGLRRLRGCDHVTFQDQRLSQFAIWRRYASHRFALSAPGNGLDCHRTWELLYLGCIVITRRSSLDPLYEGLPVVLVDDWDEVRETPNLERWSEQMAPLTDLDRIWTGLDPTRWLQVGRAALED